MSVQAAYPCIVLPCSSSLLWVLPQACLGEIVTVAASQERPPEELCWRGELVPVVDFGAAEDTGWRDTRTGSGLIAVLLGRTGQPCRFWGVALRGAGLSVVNLEGAEIEDLPEAGQDYSAAAFRLQGKIYHVPDLVAIQRALGEGVLTQVDSARVPQLEQ